LPGSSGVDGKDGCRQRCEQQRTTNGVWQGH
jgi:hypothetical protein